MKRFLFIATLLLIVVTQNLFANDYENYEIFKKGDLQYIVDFTDSLKQEAKFFWIWYTPPKNKELFKDIEIIDHVSINSSDKTYIETMIGYLAIKHFGADKVFDSKGESNIFNISYMIHIHSGKVYFLNIFFYGNVYKLITDEEILNFIEDFNIMKINIDNIERYNENVYASYEYGGFNKIFGKE